MLDFGDNVERKIQIRREVVFIILAGLFLGTLAVLNVFGLSRIIDLSFTIFGIRVPFMVFIGILPYPITFLCTDFISEFYGKRRANLVVWVGLLLNLWVLFIMWLGSILPPHPVIIEGGLPAVDDPNYTFFKLRMLTKSAVAASMIAYLTAQFVDVHIFHILRKLTKGKHLWLRNNGSTLTSQMVDSVAVITITYFLADVIKLDPDKTVFQGLIVYILSNYIFKMVSALFDTGPFYLGTKILKKYLQIDPNKQFK